MELQASNPALPIPLLPPHVLIFPAPFQGHVNSMLKLTEFLSIAGVHVTFVNTEHCQKCLTRSTDIEARLQKYQGFHFKIIPDSLPIDHSTTLLDIYQSMDLKSKPIFKQMLMDITPSVHFIIGDGILGFVLDTAVELGIPIIHFRTISACSFWSYFCISDMIEAGELPIRGEEDMDRLIRNVPGTETFLRCRDLPSFCRSSNVEDPINKLVAQETRNSTRAQTLIFNTFKDLEGPILSQIRNHYPKIYTIGPNNQINPPIVSGKLIEAA